MKFIDTAFRTIRNNLHIQSSIISVNNVIDGHKISENIRGDAVPYENIPGPKPFPFIGNTWRFLPYIGIYILHNIYYTYIHLFTYLY